MEQALEILKIFLFFLFLFVSLKILTASLIEKMFKKSAIWQIQLFIIFMSIIMAYLLSEAIVSLMETTNQLLG